MIRNNVRFYPLSKKNSLLVGSILLINIAMSHKCYVCGPHNSDANATDIPSCKLFDPNNTKFVRICPSGTVGCSLQINGTAYMRSCENIAFETCKIVNKVDYCYCKGELCNTYNRPSDDEDTTLEGSGQRSISDSGSSNRDDGVLLLTDVTRNMMHVTPSTTQAISTATLPTERGVHTTSSSSSYQTIYYMCQINFLLTISIIIYRYVFLQ